MNTPLNTSQSFRGQAAFVTGGSRGIGAAIVRRFARDGAAVTFTYASSPDKAQTLVHEIEATGGRAHAIRADSADAAALQSAIDESVRHFGRLDLLVNNAGLLQLGPVDSFPLADFDRMLAVNVRAVFVATQAAARHLGEGGRIVNIGSVSAVRSGFPGSSVYSMSKAAIAGLTRGLAIDFAPRGITVNSVQPGPAATDMNPADAPYLEAVVNLIPLKRLGGADEIASMVAYLAGPEAAFVTGACLTIDGGYTA